MAWVLLAIAGVMEVGWAYTMKLSDGFTRPFLSLITLGLMTASVVLLSFAMRTLPLGTAYTIWTGIGAVGAFWVGIIALGEPLTWQRTLAAAMIVGGIVLMKATASSS